MGRRAQLHDQPALLRSRAIGHPLCGGDDREGPGRFAARGRAQEAAGTGSPRAAHAQHRGRQPHQPLQRGARQGTGNLKQRRRWSMSRTIKFAKAGGPEVLEFIETRVPTPGPREVRINVKAIGINRAESMWRNDAYIEPVKFPAGLGYEAAGIVDAVGKDVTGFAAGDEVNLVPSFSMNQYFTYGEVILAPDYAVVKHPKSLSFTEAASIWMMFVTVYGALSEGVTRLPVLEMIAKMPTIKGHNIWLTSGDEARRKAAVEFVLKGLERGALKPVIDRTFKFDDMRDVHRYLENTGQFGKIVVTV